MVLGLDYGGRSFRQAVSCRTCGELHAIRFAGNDALHEHYRMETAPDTLRWASLSPARSP